MIFITHLKTMIDDIDEKYITDISKENSHKYNSKGGSAHRRNYSETHLHALRVCVDR